MELLPNSKKKPVCKLVNFILGHYKIKSKRTIMEVTTIEERRFIGYHEATENMLLITEFQRTLTK